MYNAFKQWLKQICHCDGEVLVFNSALVRLSYIFITSWLHNIDLIFSQIVYCLPRSAQLIFQSTLLYIILSASFKRDQKSQLRGHCSIRAKEDIPQIDQYHFFPANIYYKYLLPVKTDYYEKSKPPSCCPHLFFNVSRKGGRALWDGNLTHINTRLHLWGSEGKTLWPSYRG